MEWRATGASSFRGSGPPACGSRRGGGGGPSRDLLVERGPPDTVQDPRYFFRTPVDLVEGIVARRLKVEVKVSDPRTTTFRSFSSSF
jgi:hypothetical protein